MGLEWNGNKTWLSSGAGMGMGMNHWEREGVGLRKKHPRLSPIYSSHHSLATVVFVSAADY